MFDTKYEIRLPVCDTVGEGPFPCALQLNISKLIHGMCKRNHIIMVSRTKVK